MGPPCDRNNAREASWSRGQTDVNMEKSSAFWDALCCQPCLGTPGAASSNEFTSGRSPFAKASQPGATNPISVRRSLAATTPAKWKTGCSTDNSRTISSATGPCRRRIMLNPSAQLPKSCSPASHRAPGAQTTHVQRQTANVPGESPCIAAWTRRGGQRRASCLRVHHPEDVIGARRSTEQEEQPSGLQIGDVSWHQSVALLAPFTLVHIMHGAFVVLPRDVETDP